MGRTFRSSVSSPDFSITSLRTRLHFDASLIRAKRWAGLDLRVVELYIRDLNDPPPSEVVVNSCAAS